MPPSPANLWPPFSSATPADQVSADDLSGYADGAGVSAWAREAMNWAVAQGLITGKSGGRLDPGGTASRAEVSAILMRYVQSAQA